MTDWIWCEKCERPHRLDSKIGQRHSSYGKKMTYSQDQLNIEEDVKDFCGWIKLGKIIRGSENEALLSTLFLTGLRIHEVLPYKKGFGLKRKHFDFESDPIFVDVKGVPILKRWKWRCSECGKEWSARPSPDEREEHTIGPVRRKKEKHSRHYPIHKKLYVKKGKFSGDEEMVQEQRKEYLNRCSSIYDEVYEWMASKIKSVSSGYIFDMEYIDAYKVCREAGEGIIEKKDEETGEMRSLTSPHWFRAQRACQLSLDLRADAQDLLEYFQWKDEKTANRYASLGSKGLKDRRIG